MSTANTNNYQHKYLKYKAKYLALRSNSMVGGKKGTKVNKQQGLALAKKLNINLKTVSLADWTFGLNVELEHGKRLGAITNITNDKLETTARIVIAHLMEFPDYYNRLKQMERKADKYWEGRVKPGVFNSK